MCWVNGHPFLSKGIWPQEGKITHYFFFQRKLLQYSALLLGLPNAGPAGAK